MEFLMRDQIIHFNEQVNLITCKPHTSCDAELPISSIPRISSSWFLTDRIGGLKMQT